MCRGEIDAAKECYRQALRLSADATHAMNALLGLCESRAERRDALEFIWGEMLRQVLVGASLLTFRELAQQTLEPDELLRSLQKALTARPDLWHAWSAVACQLRDMERLDEALDMLETALERFPLLPALWLDLANVHEARKDQAAAIAALQKALAISPAWGPPLRRLTEIHRRRGDIDEAHALAERAVARAAVERGASRQPGDAALGHRRALSGLRSHSPDRVARSRLRECLEQPVRVVGRSGVLPGCRRACPQPDRIAPGATRSWLRLVEALLQMPDAPSLRDDPARLAECLQALERVFALEPRLLEAHDLKAQVLAAAKRWRDAEAACQDRVWGQRPPIPLRGRLAWIAFERGKHEQAVERMTRVLQDDPDYYWGWAQLAGWHAELGNPSEHLQACEMLRALDPHNPSCYVRRADARRALNDRAGAITDYQRARELAPEYLYPAHQLFDMHLEDGDTTAAHTILDALDPNADPGEYRIRTIVLANAENNAQAALAALEDLCAAKDFTVLEDAVAALEEADLGTQVEEVLRRFLGAGAEVCQQWVAITARSVGLENLGARIGQLPPKHIARIDVLLAYADALADAAKAELTDGGGSQAMRLRLQELIRQDTTVLRARHSTGARSALFSPALCWMRKPPSG